MLYKHAKTILSTRARHVIGQSGVRRKDQLVKLLRGGFDFRKMPNCGEQTCLEIERYAGVITGRRVSSDEGRKPPTQAAIKGAITVLSRSGLDLQAITHRINKKRVRSANE